MTILTCSEFDRLLMERTAERRSRDDRLRCHAASCARCGALWQDEQDLDAAIRAWRRGVPEVDLRERIVASLPREVNDVAVARPVVGSPPTGTATPARRTGAAIVVLAAAAALMLALSLPSPRESEEGGNAVRRVAGGGVGGPRLPSRKPQNREQEMPVEQLVAGVQTHYAGVARSVSRTVGRWRLTWPSINAPAVDLLPDFPRSPKPAPARTTGATAGWTGGLSPIERDVRKAFSFLSDVVPDADGSST